MRGGVGDKVCLRGGVGEDVFTSEAGSFGGKSANGAGFLRFAGTRGVSSSLISSIWTDEEFSVH